MRRHSQLDKCSNNYDISLLRLGWGWWNYLTGSEGPFYSWPLPLALQLPMLAVEDTALELRLRYQPHDLCRAQKHGPQWKGSSSSSRPPCRQQGDDDGAWGGPSRRPLPQVWAAEGPHRSWLWCPLPATCGEELGWAGPTSWSRGAQMIPSRSSPLSANSENTC